MPAACAALLTVLLYANALDNPFVYDDFRLIVENPSIQNLSDVRTVLVRDITRPLVGLSYAVDTAIWGTRPFGYHLTNLVLHAVNVVLVFWVAWCAANDWRRRGGRLSFSPPPAVVAATTSVLMAAHPVMTQAVGYVTGRSEVLYALFFLSSLLAARRWMHAGGWWRAVSVGCWALSLMAKETAAMLPLVLWCYDAWLMEGDAQVKRRRAKSLYVPLGVVVLCFAAGRLAVLATVEYPSGAGPDWRYALVAVDAFWQYFGLFVWPKGQSIMHMLPLVTGMPARVAAGVLGLAALAAAVWTLRRRQGMVSLGLVLSAAVLVPSSVLFALGVGEPMAEHRAYLSAAGFFLACGALVGMAWEKARSLGRGTLALGTAGATVVVQLAGLTLVRNDVWASPVRLAREAVGYAPTHWMPRLLLGETLRQNGRCQEAVPEYRTVMAMRPGDTFAYTKALSCLLQTGRVPEAEQVLQELRAVDPESQEAAMAMGLLAVARGQTGQSRQHFNAVIARNPSHVQAHQFVALLDGSLVEPQRTSLCGVVRALAPLAASGTTAAAASPCP